MLRALILLFLVPTALFAQTPSPKTSAPAAAKPSAPTAGAPLTDEEKTVYALGLLMERSLRQFDLSARELEIVERALTDAAAGKPTVDIAQWGALVEPLAQARATRVATREKAAGAEYLTKAAAQPGAIQLASGLVYREVAAGAGESPKATDTVKVHYRGTLIDGTEFDSSYARNEPAQFSVRGVIPCWTEGLQRMKVGGKARLGCPSSLAYGDGGNQAIPGGATLSFEVELLEIVAAPAAQRPN